MGMLALRIVNRDGYAGVTAGRRASDGDLGKN